MMSEVVAIASIAVLFVAYALLQRRAGSPSDEACHADEDEACTSCTHRTDCTELNDARV